MSEVSVSDLTGPALSFFVASIYAAITSSGNVNGIDEGPQATRAPNGVSMTDGVSVTPTGNPSNSFSKSAGILASSPTGSMRTTSQSMPTSTSTIVASSQKSLLPTVNHAKHHHISGGAIAGIVIGVIVAVVLLGVLLFFCCCRKCLHRRRKRDTAAAAGKADALNRRQADDEDSGHRDGPQTYFPMQERQNETLAAHSPRTTSPLEISTVAHQTATRVIDAPVSGTSTFPALQQTASTTSENNLENPRRGRQDRSSTGYFFIFIFFSLPPAVLPRGFGHDTPSFQTEDDQQFWPLAISPLDTDGEGPNPQLSQIGAQHENLQQQYPWQQHPAFRPLPSISPLPALQQPPRVTILSTAAQEYADITGPWDKNARLSYGVDTSSLAGTRTSIGAPPSVSWATPPDAGRLSKEWGDGVRSSAEERIRQWNLSGRPEEADSPISRPVSGLGDLPSELNRISTSDEPFGGVQEYLKKLSMISSNAGEGIEESRQRQARPPRYD